MFQGFVGINTYCMNRVPCLNIDREGLGIEIYVVGEFG